VSLVPTREVPSNYANEQPIILNGVPVYRGLTDDSLLIYTYYAPSLGVEVTAHGPLARRVVGTLMSSPRVRHSRQALHLRFHHRGVSCLSRTSLSVPANWPVERTETWNLCGPVDIVSAQGVTLDTDKTFLALPCPAPLPFPVMPSDGCAFDSGAQGPTGSFSAGGTCLHIGGLTACPSSTPDYSVLLLRATVPGRAKPVFVSIGLAGSGMVARTILYSLRVV